jgi:hypothetical protein
MSSETGGRLAKTATRALNGPGTTLRGRLRSTDQNKLADNDINIEHPNCNTHPLLR